MPDKQSLSKWQPASTSIVASLKLNCAMLIPLDCEAHAPSYSKPLMKSLGFDRMVRRIQICGALNLLRETLFTPEEIEVILQSVLSTYDTLFEKWTTHRDDEEEKERLVVIGHFSSAINALQYQSPFTTRTEIRWSSY